MSRKKFSYIVGVNTVTVQRLTYADMDANATVAESVEFNVADVPAELSNGLTMQSLAAYGLSQFLQDRTASVSSEDKLTQMSAVFETICDGKWKEARASSGVSVKKATIDSFFARGFAQYLQSKGKDFDELDATIILQSMDAERRKALRTHPDIKAFVEQAKASALAAVEDFDLDSIL